MIYPFDVLICQFEISFDVFLCMSFHIEGSRWKIFVSIFWIKLLISLFDDQWIQYVLVLVDEMFVSLLFAFTVCQVNLRKKLKGFFQSNVIHLFFFSTWMSDYAFFFHVIFVSFTLMNGNSVICWSVIMYQ